MYKNGRSSARFYYRTEKITQQFASEIANEVQGLVL